MMRHFTTLAVATLMVCAIAHAGPREAKLAMEGPTDPNANANITPNGPERAVDRIAAAAIKQMQTASIDTAKFSVTHDPDTARARMDRLKERVNRNTDALLTERDHVLDRLAEELSRAEDARHGSMNDAQNTFNSNAGPHVKDFIKKAEEIVSEKEMGSAFKKRPATIGKAYDPATKLRYSFINLPSF